MRHRTISRSSAMVPLAGAGFVGFPFVGFLFIWAPGFPCCAQTPRWTGAGDYRLLVQVAPIELGVRSVDERPAELTIDWRSTLQTQFNLAGKADINSVQIVRYDPTTGEPYAGDWAYGKSPLDRAFRWYDSDVPHPYPEVETYLSDTPFGTLTPISRPNWGYFLDVEGDWESGRLAWSHVQQGNAPAHYAIYFNAIDENLTPYRAAPRGFLGDGGMRTEKTGATTTGAIETRIDVADWDGDGLFDLVAGNLRGAMTVYRNLGTASAPSFGSSKLVTTIDGNPVDVGWNATPLVVDFDNDGIEDLVTGGQLNRIGWYKNTGTNADRRLVYRGLVRNSAGQTLVLPTTPNPERPTITADYYPVMDMVDLDGDGERDLIAGGYITGRLYYFKNVGLNADGTPRLESQGPLTAGGQPIDVEWGAAPTFADFNGDGLLDFVTGTFAIDSGVTSSKFLQYYRNVGSSTAPAFQLQTFPRVGQFPTAALGSPRAVDYNADGLLDLAVSSDEQIYLYRNIGTPTSPRWAVGASPLPSQWGPTPLFASQFADWNGDGHLDKIQGLTVALNRGLGSPEVYGPAASVLPAGQAIPPKPGGGDGWQWLRLFDLDADGELDVMDADHDGKIWLHRNVGDETAPNFDVPGVVLTTLGGAPIDVGPGPADPSFDQLQGSRATYSVADFNGNGRPDLVVVNFAGIVRYYENETADLTMPPIFTPATVVGQLPTRGVPFSADWDGDGDLDVLASSGPGEMLFIENSGIDAGGRATFAGGVWVDLVDAPYDSIGLNVVDFNGDGDADVLVDTTHRYSIFADGSFLQHGYAQSALHAAQRLADGVQSDLDADADVDGTDFLIWQRQFGKVGSQILGDANLDGVVNGGDHALWRAQFGNRAGVPLGSVPEPTSLVLLLIGAWGRNGVAFHQFRRARWTSTILSRG